MAGFSAYSRVVDWARFRAIADDVGALLLADIAHVAGLIAAGLYPNPVPLADVTTTTTHKTLRGPRGGMILAARPRRDGANRRRRVSRHAGRAADARDRRQSRRVPRSARALVCRVSAASARQRAAMAKVLIERGYAIMTGGTDNHMLLVDLRGTRVDATHAERALHAAHIAVNRASLPGDAGSEPTKGDGGLRLGTPAVTTRGLAEPEIRTLSGWIADVLDAAGAEPVVARVRTEVLKMCARSPGRRKRQEARCASFRARFGACAKDVAHAAYRDVFTAVPIGPSWAHEGLALRQVRNRALPVLQL